MVVKSRGLEKGRPDPDFLSAATGREPYHLVQTISPLQMSVSPSVNGNERTSQGGFKNVTK